MIKTRSKVEVLIVGSGSAGLTLAAQLAAFPSINTCIIEKRSGPLLVGQADGIACRSVEMFEALGFSEKVLKESYWVNETSFWRPNEDGDIARHNRIQDVEDDLSEFPHLILNQARVHDFLLEKMRQNANRLDVNYGCELINFSINNDKYFPIEVTIKQTQTSGSQTIKTVRAAYLVGCDGARSTVRKTLGLSLIGDSANKGWGVMDVLASTNFPDIRLKCAIQSEREGSMLIIPREGGYMVRLYIELDKLNPDERVADRNITSDQIIEAANRILHPYTLNVHEIAWWSVYDIGQRLCDSFDDVPLIERSTRHPRVFIAGDACHTHSPKAGQGMNVSFADAFNLGWKLAAVINEQSPPSLLHTYTDERHAKALELIEFDKELAQLFISKSTQTDTFQRYFIKHGRYTAGVETRYDPSLITANGKHQSLAKGFTIGRRFHSAPVIRLADAKPMHLGHTLKADGRWRIFLFADNREADISTTSNSLSTSLSTICRKLNANDSIIHRITPRESDIDAIIDVRAILQSKHRDVDINGLPALLSPRKGVYGLTDYEKVFCPDFKHGPNIFDHREIDQNHGCMVVIRPDQYVANILPLTAYEELQQFFEQCLLTHRQPQA